jgi:hypothetical protein
MDATDVIIAYTLSQRQIKIEGEAGNNETRVAQWPYRGGVKENADRATE